MSATHHFRIPDASAPLGGWRSWRGTLARSLYAGVLLGMISGFLTLLFSIATVVLWQFLLHRIEVDLSIIYRQIAPAVACSVAVLAFLGNIVYERTHPAPPARTGRT